MIQGLLAPILPSSLLYVVYIFGQDTLHLNYLFSPRDEIGSCEVMCHFAWWKNYSLGYYRDVCKTGLGLCTFVGGFWYFREKRFMKTNIVAIVIL